MYVLHLYISSTLFRFFKNLITLYINALDILSVSFRPLFALCCQMRALKLIIFAAENPNRVYSNLILTFNKTKV